jgi:H+/gluconate symporter-like permease
MLEWFQFLCCLGALAFLIFMAYRGHSVILFAPVAALAAVLLSSPYAVAPVYTSYFMTKMVVFVQLYFPVFLLGAIFGKVIEMSGFAKSIVKAVFQLLGPKRAMVSIVTVCALLTYGGVSLFVVVFAVYPFAAEMFREADIPKRLIPGTVALGSFTFTMDSLPGTPQIQNIIPTTFFHTTGMAAPILGTLGSLFIIVVGLSYLEWRRRAAAAKGEGYGAGHILEPEPISDEGLVNPVIAILPLVVVGVMNIVLTLWIIPALYTGDIQVTLTAGGTPITAQLKSILGIWAVIGALLLGILTVFVFAWRTIVSKFAEGSKSAIGGALLATMNTASEYGFGAVIAVLPGFVLIAHALAAIPNPLVNEAISVTSLAGITGSASGGMGIALAALSSQFIAAAQAHGIPMEVLHRVASMASGGMDTLPHNGAVITLLSVTGLTHRQSYVDIFAVTVTKTSAVFVVIAIYYLTGWV